MAAMRSLRERLWVRWERLRERLKWTGFFAYTDADGKVQRGRTLWEWFDLLIVPAVLAVGAIGFSYANRQSDIDSAKRRLQEERLNAYLAKMEGYILDRDLLNAEVYGESSRKRAGVIRVAQVQTVTALRSMDKERRNLVFQFLRDSSLIEFVLVDASLAGIDLSETDLHWANLEDADLSGAELSGAELSLTEIEGADLEGANLSGAHLHYADLRGANLKNANLIRAIGDGAGLSEAELSGANLSGAKLESASLLRADLREADLSGAYLDGAFLREADLFGADLSGADLSWADLFGADLSGADLSGADLSLACLSEATITEEQLSTVYSLEGAVMPDENIEKCRIPK